MPLSDEALAVRGGTLRDPERIRAKVLDAIEDGDGPVLSLWSDDPHEDEHREDLVRRLSVDGDIPHKSLQVGSVGAIRAAVSDFRQDSSSGEPVTHFHAVFSEPVALSQVEAFILAMNTPEPNPTGGKP